MLGEVSRAFGLLGVSAGRSADAVRPSAEGLIEHHVSETAEARNGCFRCRAFFGFFAVGGGADERVGVPPRTCGVRWSTRDLGRPDCRCSVRFRGGRVVTDVTGAALILGRRFAVRVVLHSGKHREAVRWRGVEVQWFGQPGRIRTGDVPFRKRWLCPLSYRLGETRPGLEPGIGRLCRPPPAPARSRASG